MKLSKGFEYSKAMTHWQTDIPYVLDVCPVVPFVVARGIQAVHALLPSVSLYVFAGHNTHCPEWRYLPGKHSKMLISLLIFRRPTVFAQDKMVNCLQFA